MHIFVVEVKTKLSVSQCCDARSVIGSAILVHLRWTLFPFVSVATKNVLGSYHEKQHDAKYEELQNSFKILYLTLYVVYMIHVQNIVSISYHLNIMDS